MRILAISYLFPNRHYPNRGIFVANRLRAMQSTAEVRVINPIPWFPCQNHLARYRKYDQIPREDVIAEMQVFHPRFFAFPLIWKHFAAHSYAKSVAAVVEQLWRHWQFDVIDLHWTFPDLHAGRLLRSRYARPMFVTVRGEAALHLNERGYRNRSIRTLLPTSDHVIALSAPLASHCIQLGVPESRVTVVHNGIDPTRFRRLDKLMCRNQLALPHDQRIVLGIGYLTHHKGFDRIIQALARLPRHLTPTHAYLIGPGGALTKGDVSSQLRALARHYGISERIHLVGECNNEQLAFWYSAADLFCLSSRTEGCPNVLVEALSCGCPVVSSNVGAASDFVSSPSVGILVPNSTEGICEGIALALQRDWDRGEIARTMESHTWSRCAEQLQGIYARHHTIATI